VTTGAIRRAKLQSHRHHQQTNTQLFTGQMPFLSPNQQCQRTEGNTQGVRKGGTRGLATPQWLHITVSGEAILGAEYSGKPLRGRDSAPNPAGGSQRSFHRPFCWWCLSQRNPSPLLALSPNENSWAYPWEHSAKCQ